MSNLPPQRKQKTRVQLSDIAAQTGVSLSTVSKVLNGRMDVSKQTRQKVSEALKSSGYHRRKSGTKSNRYIEVVFESFDTSRRSMISASSPPKAVTAHTRETIGSTAYSEENPME